MITVEANKIDLAKVKTTLGLIKKNVSPVIYRAINKSIGINRTFFINQVYKDLNLTKTRIRSGFKSKAGNWLVLKANSGRLRGQYWASGGPVGLINFIGTKSLAKGKGVSVKIKRNGSRFHLKHAFIREIKGAKNVWQRSSTARGGRAYVPGRQYAGFMEKVYGRRYRLPIERMAGPRIQDIMAYPGVYVLTDRHAVETLQKNIDSQLAYELSKL